MGHNNQIDYASLPSFIQRRKKWRKEAVANGQHTLARVLLEGIEKTEKLLKEQPKEEIKQLELWN